MENQIQKIKNEFSYEPKIENEEKLADFSRVVICGMGGSHIPGDFVKLLSPRNIIVHKNYGLPDLSDEEAKETLFVAVSHSGNTEETLDFAKKAHEKEYALATASTGGSLLEFAEEKNLPHVVVPKTELPPRLSSGSLTNAVLALMQEKEMLEKVQNISDEVNTDNLKEKGSEVAEFLSFGIPIIYASDENKSLAYYLKIILNESVKIPAFSNVFPELNHNEMAGFAGDGVLNDFHFLILKDESDRSRVQKRIDVFSNMIKERGGNLRFLDISSENNIKKILELVIVANWTSYMMAEKRGVDADDTSFIEEFKKLIN